ncbi:peptide-methionine (R)-S-oxide reductase MsrB [Akkermansiaceae bacterium]|nr:peptide-methionine (R)-S-oxide reductase MsrB [Akkermansiaceae bacterium]MDB4547029.1 peptide-methionine (R)-S-oxide reductase MsrB [Akkermansiaceae bacterium]MDB4725105.1 peptide-methionine (R)-S-oxide reductase MsrB [Akkermansiaceae bacterium]
MSIELFSAIDKLRKFDGTKSLPYSLIIMKTAILLAAFLPFLLVNCTEQEPMSTQSTHPEQPEDKVELSSTETPTPAKPVELTDEEWKAKLTPEQYRILREAGTEGANGAVYKQFKAQGAGTYYCVGCDTKLFHSETKFDSKCGWPSFYDPAKSENVITDTDYHMGYARTEVRCKTCDGHLGHVFAGEGFDTPTDQRYCINGTVLKFVPDAPEKE